MDLTAESLIFIILKKNLLNNLFFSLVHFKHDGIMTSLNVQSVCILLMDCSGKAIQSRSRILNRPFQKPIKLLCSLTSLFKQD